MQTVKVGLRLGLRVRRILGLGLGFLGLEDQGSVLVEVKRLNMQECEISMKRSHNAKLQAL